jgi:hypothetical protein
MISAKNYNKTEPDYIDDASTYVSEASSSTLPPLPCEQAPTPPPAEVLASDAKQCIVCETKFGGMFKSKKLNCDVCGAAVCAKHSAVRARFDTPEDVRVCDICTRSEEQAELRKKYDAKITRLRTEKKKVACSIGAL